MQCCGCNADYPEYDNQGGPTHAYMLSSPGCWAAYGVVLAREYQDRRYAPLHRLTVDTYAVQHPGIDTPQARNSVGIHLSRLYLMVELHLPIERANQAMLAITAKKKSYPWLTPPADRGALNLHHILPAITPEEHLPAIRQWASAVWQAWSEHHDTIRLWNQVLTQPTA